MRGHQDRSDCRGDISYASSFSPPPPRNNKPMLDHVRDVKEASFLTDKLMTVTNALVGIKNRH